MKVRNRTAHFGTKKENIVATNPATNAITIPRGINQIEIRTKVKVKIAARKKSGN